MVDYSQNVIVHGVIWCHGAYTCHRFPITALSYLAGLGQRTSPNIKILYTVAKSSVRQIWETDCTQERTCNEHGPVGGCHEQGTNIKRVNEPYVTE